MVIHRPNGFKPSSCTQHKLLSTDTVIPGFIIHPSTSELAEMLTIDPQALNNENYSGIYDGTGDYIPQYCDDPDKIPRGGLSANQESSSQESSSQESSSQESSSQESSTE